MFFFTSKAILAEFYLVCVYMRSADLYVMAMFLKQQDKKLKEKKHVYRQEVNRPVGPWEKRKLNGDFAMISMWGIYTLSAGKKRAFVRHSAISA